MTNIQAIDLLKGLEQSLDDYCELNDEGKTAFHMAITALEVFGNSEQLPSAQPERKGRWIKLDMHAHLADHKCTACGQECYVPTCMGEPMYTYCPNCGAKMRGEQDEDR